MEDNINEDFEVSQTMVIARIIRIEAALETLILMQSQLMAKIEERPKNEIYDNAQKEIINFSRDIIKQLKEQQ